MLHLFVQALPLSALQSVHLAYMVFGQGATSVTKFFSWVSSAKNIARFLTTNFSLTFWILPQIDTGIIALNFSNVKTVELEALWLHPYH